MSAEPTKTYRSRAEIESTIRGFSVADAARLTKTSKLFAAGTGWDGDDLIQEAFTRTLEGTRNCPIDVDLMKHLIDTMSSIANAEHKKAHNLMPHVPVLQEDDEFETADPPSLDGSPEDLRLMKEEYDKIRALFDDDPKAREMVDGIIAGFTTEELKEFTGLQGTAYDSKRTLIWRRMVKFLCQRKNNGQS